ncbi:3-oxoacyl-[acyl-carrier-protein] synthase III C-terminal domain-containing protein [Dongia sp. agr-C8]
MSVVQSVARHLAGGKTEFLIGSQGVVHPIAIAGTGSYLPARVLDAATFDTLVGKPLGWSEKASGVRSRHVVQHETVIDMAAAAASQAIARAGIAAQDLDCIIAAAALAHQPIPTSAVLIQRALGLPTSGIPAFDVNATCLSFLAALDLAGALITAGRYRTILVTAADMPSQGTRLGDPEIKAMFGDGAAAAVLKPGERPGQGVVALRMETYSEGAEACTLRAGGTGLSPHGDLKIFLDATWFEMDGPLAYRVSARYMPGFLERLLGAAGVTLDDIDLVIPHQASAHALHLMRRRLGVPAAKLIDLLAERGNQVSASIPSMLDHALASGRARKGDLILLIGTAAGITLGGAVIRL